MPTAVGVVATTRAGRYLVQLCRHAGRMRPHRLHGGLLDHDRAGSLEVQRTEWADTHGVLRLNHGVCTVRATPDALRLHVDADDDEALRRIQNLLTARLEGFGRRDDLRVDWQQAVSTSSNQQNRTAATVPDPAVMRRVRRGVPRAVLVLVPPVVIALHLGLVGTLLSAPHRAAGAIELVVAAVALKLLVVVVLGLRRRRTPPA